MRVHVHMLVECVHASIMLARPGWNLVQGIGPDASNGAGRPRLAGDREPGTSTRSAGRDAPGTGGAVSWKESSPRGCKRLSTQSRCPQSRCTRSQAWPSGLRSFTKRAERGGLTGPKGPLPRAWIGSLEHLRRPEVSVAYISWSRGRPGRLRQALRCRPSSVPSTTSKR